MKLLWTALIALVLGLLLGFAVGRWMRWTPLDPYDARLIGTWVSDGERTLERLERFKGRPRQEFQKFADLFGKLEVTYTRSTISSNFPGNPLPDSSYRVVASDERSVVIQQEEAAPSDPNVPDLSESSFNVIYFDGPDAYWLRTSSGLVEYFKRK